jgi:ABC-type sulfate/molybdate transport systems ATPase subunit
LDELNSGPLNKVAIGGPIVATSGPKGVGKSLALAAIATLFRKDGKKCFLRSPWIDSDHLFHEYVWKFLVSIVF